MRERERERDSWTPAENLIRQNVAYKCFLKKQEVLRALTMACFGL